MRILKSHDWFEAVIAAKRASMDYKRSTSKQNLKVIRAARNKVQKTARCFTNEYWSELSEAIQTAALTGNI